MAYVLAPDGAQQACSSDFERTGGAEQDLSKVFEAGAHEVYRITVF